MSGYFKDKFYIHKRKGTSEDPYVEVPIETHRISNAKAVLNEIPDEFNGVTVINSGYSETTGAISNSFQYRVDYSLGYVYFHENANGIDIDFTYTGTGWISMPASRIYLEVNDNEPNLTVKDQLDKGRFIWQEPVNTFSDISSAYPSPGNGWVTQSLDTGKIYKYESGIWKWIQTIAITSQIDDINNTIGNTDLLTKPTISEAIKDINDSKSSVSDSATNGNIVIDGVETQIYDGSGKSNVGHTHSLASLSDVTIVSPTDGQVLKYSSGKWQPGTDNSGSSGVIIDDTSTTSTTKTWSAQKINNEIDSVMAGSSRDTVYASDFSGANDTAKIQAAIDYARSNSKKRVFLPNGTYSVNSTITLKEGVFLVFDYNAKLFVSGNSNTIVMEKNSSIHGMNVEIVDTNFNAAVIYLDGSNNFYNTWRNTSITKVKIINVSGSYKGVGIYCYAAGSGDEVSFVNFVDVKIVSMNKAIKLEAVDPGDGSYAWVTACRFDKFSLEDCVEFVQMIGAKTIPNVVGGNHFTAMQLQPSGNTQNLFTITGEHNYLDGMCWDLFLIPHSNSIVNLTANSQNTVFDFPAVPDARITNNGTGNTKPTRTSL